MKYGKLTLGQIEAVVNKLGGEEGVKLFLADHLFLTSMDRVLRTIHQAKFRTVEKDIREVRKLIRPF